MTTNHDDPLAPLDTRWFRVEMLPRQPSRAPSRQRQSLPVSYIYARRWDGGRIMLWGGRSGGMHPCSPEDAAKIVRTVRSGGKVVYPNAAEQRELNSEFNYQQSR